MRVEIEITESGHLRPLAGSGHLRPLAATCWELSGAATCGHLRPLAWSGHLRPLAATLAATCGHSSGCEWLRVAASGCEWLRAGRNTWQSWHLEKNRFCWKSVFFKFGGWIGRILSCLTKPCGKPYATHVFHSVGRGRSINGGRTELLKRRSWRIAPMMVQCWKVEGKIFERSKMTVECWKWKRYPRA